MKCLLLIDFDREVSHTSLNELRFNETAFSSLGNSYCLYTDRHQLTILLNILHDTMKLSLKTIVLFWKREKIVRELNEFVVLKLWALCFKIASNIIYEMLPFTVKQPVEKFYEMTFISCAYNLRSLRSQELQKESNSLMQTSSLGGSIEWRLF